MKEHINIIFLLGLMLCSTTILAQFTINGTAKDKDTKEGLPFAHIVLEGGSTVAVSDFDGVFSITIPKGEMGEELVISVMGYENFEMSVQAIQTQNIKEFLLESAVFELAEAIVRSPEKILSDAIDKIEENFWIEDFLLEGFYRKAAVEGGQFAYLTEAIIRVSNEGYHKQSEHSIGVEIMQLRSSEDFRQIEVLEHRNPLFIGMYDRDLIKSGGIKDVLKKARTNLAELETTVYNGEDIYIIKVKPFYVYIGFNNDEIYRIDIGGNRDLGRSYQYRKYKGKLYPFYNRRKWMPKRSGNDDKIGNVLVRRYYDRNIQREAETEVAGTMQPKGQKEDATKYFTRQNWRVKNVQKTLSKAALEETPINNIGMVHEFTATKLVLKSEENYKIKPNIELNEDLFKTKVYYDTKFWNNYKSATESKYFQLIRADLEAAANGKSLELQFSEVGKVNNESSRKFKKRMEKEEK